MLRSIRSGPRFSAEGNPSGMRPERAEIGVARWMCRFAQLRDGAVVFLHVQRIDNGPMFRAEWALVIFRMLRSRHSALLTDGGAASSVRLCAGCTPRGRRPHLGTGLVATVFTYVASAEAIPGGESADRRTGELGVSRVFGAEPHPRRPERPCCRRKDHPRWTRAPLS
jgi:hypothetical protein